VVVKDGALRDEDSAKIAKAQRGKGRNGFLPLSLCDLCDLCVKKLEGEISETYAPKARLGAK
jgi:hypothetical protein